METEFECTSGIEGLLSVNKIPEGILLEIQKEGLYSMDFTLTLEDAKELSRTLKLLLEKVE